MTPQKELFGRVVVDLRLIKSDALVDEVASVGVFW
jgi:hypothetical protein